MKGPLGEFLNRFKKISEARDEARRVLKESIQEECAITLTDDDILIKDDIADIKGSGALKNALFMKKKEILTRVNSLLERKLLDVR